MLLVVLAFFAKSCQLSSLQHPPPPRGAGSQQQLQHLTVDNCWLCHPACVKPSTASKRVRELSTGCVLPAARSNIDHSAWAAAAAAAAAVMGGQGSTRQHLQGRQQLEDRHVTWKRSGGGYIQLSFDLKCGVAQRAVPDADSAAGHAKWDFLPRNQPKATHRVEMMLHQLMLYLTKGYTREWHSKSVQWQQLQAGRQQLQAGRKLRMRAARCRRRRRCRAPMSSPPLPSPHPPLQS